MHFAFSAGGFTLLEWAFIQAFAGVIQKCRTIRAEAITMGMMFMAI
jgi:hypothetical protein